MNEPSGEQLAKFIMKAVREIEVLATLMSWVACFGLGIILAYLLGVWVFAHMNVVVGVVLAQIGIAALGIWLGDE